MLRRTLLAAAGMSFANLLLTSGCKHAVEREVLFSANQLKPVCVGRARMQLPARSMVTYQRAQIAQFNLAWRPVPATSFASAWQTRLQAMSQDGEIIEHESANNRQALATSHGKASADLDERSWESWTSYGDHALIATSYFRREQDALAQSALRIIHSSFVPETGAVPSGFCVPGGVVQTVAETEAIDAIVEVEHSSLQSHPALLHIAMDMVTSPAQPSLFQRVDGARFRLPGVLGGVKTLRRGDRRVAGHMGQEFVSLQKGSDGFGINAQLEFVGIANRRDAPYLHLTLDGDYPATLKPEQVLAVWDQAINSFSFAQ